MAEGVEKVRTTKFCATIVRASRACCNIDSTKPQILEHYFKNFERPDFFNTLSYEQTVPIRLTQTPTTCRVPPNAGIKLGIGRCLNPAGNAKQRAEGVKRVKPPVEAERELIEVGL